MCVSPHSCLLHLFADGFYLHISLQSILFPNECLFNIGTHAAAGWEADPNSCRVCREGKGCALGRGLCRVPCEKNWPFPHLFTCKGSGMMTLASGKGRSWGCRGAPCMSHLLPQRPLRPGICHFTREAKKPAPFSLFCAPFFPFSLNFFTLEGKPFLYRISV